MHRFEPVEFVMFAFVMFAFVMFAFVMFEFVKVISPAKHYRASPMLEFRLA